MLRQLKNWIKGVEPCIAHVYDLTDVEDVGSYNIIWKYTVTCLRCGHKQQLNERDLKKKIELGIIELEESVIRNIFKNYAEEELPNCPKPREF